MKRKNYSIKRTESFYVIAMLDDQQKFSGWITANTKTKVEQRSQTIDRFTPYGKAFKVSHWKAEQDDTH